LVKKNVTLQYSEIKRVSSDLTFLKNEVLQNTILNLIFYFFTFVAKFFSRLKWLISFMICHSLSFFLNIQLDKFYFLFLKRETLWHPNDLKDVLSTKRGLLSVGLYFGHSNRWYVVKLQEKRNKEMRIQKARLIIWIKHVKQTEQIFSYKLTRISIDNKYFDRNCFEAVNPKVLNRQFKYQKVDLIHRVNMNKTMGKSITFYFYYKTS